MTKKHTHPVIVGHRGSRGELGENTPAAIRWAIKHQVHEIETDCRLTSDGVVVQHHDPYFVASDGTLCLIAEHTYAELHAAHPDCMTLPEMFELVNRRARLMLEIKPDVSPAPIIAIVRDYLDRGWQPDDFSFASFSFPILQAVHKALPQIDRIVLEGWLAPRALWRARQLDTKYLSMNQQYLWWGFIRWAVRHNHKIYTYPYPRTRLPFNHQKPQRWIKHGLHGIITDKPELFRK